MNGYEYGNTRLRARLTRLLPPAVFDDLVLEPDVDRFLGRLAATDYAGEVEAVLARGGGHDRIDRVAGLHLARMLREAASFYTGDPGDRVRLLLLRWDLHNLQTVLRGKARAASDREILPLLVPAGTIGAARLAALAGRPSVRQAIELMVAWAIPDRDTAVALLGAWVGGPEGDIAALEAVLVRRFLTLLAERASRLRPGEAPLRRFVEDYLTATALPVALRREPGIAAGGLPAGRLPARVLAAVDRSRGAALVAEATAPHLPRRAGAAVVRWVEHGSLATLAADLDRALTEDALELLRRGDPLSIAVPVGYVAAIENEARNLRLAGKVVTDGLPPEAARRAMVVAR